MGNKQVSFNLQRSPRKGSVNVLTHNATFKKYSAPTVEFDFDDSIGWSEEMLIENEGLSKNNDQSKSVLRPRPQSARSNTKKVLSLNDFTCNRPSSQPQISRTFNFSRKEKSPQQIMKNSQFSPLSLPQQTVISHFQKISFLQELTGGVKFDVVYNSDVHGFVTNELNQRISCQSNLTFIIVTEKGEEFGFHQRDVIPPAHNYNNTPVDSKDFSLFILNGNLNKPTSFERKRPGGFTLHSNFENRFLTTCYSSFWITCERKIYIHKLLNKQFRIPRNVVNPLTGSCLCGFSVCDKLIVLKWY
ncbi:TLDc domain-containing protein [Entamoeba marina]